MAIPAVSKAAEGNEPMNAIVDTAEALREAQRAQPSKALNFIQCEDLDEYVQWLKADQISELKFWEAETDEGDKMCVTVTMANGNTYDFDMEAFRSSAAEFFPSART